GGLLLLLRSRRDEGLYGPVRVADLHPARRRSFTSHRPRLAAKSDSGGGSRQHACSLSRQRLLPPLDHSAPPSPRSTPFRCGACPISRRAPAPLGMRQLLGGVSLGLRESAQDSRDPFHCGARSLRPRTRP